ncbi:hypothetical protein DYB26_004414 [Aphanomyces astaci]|uniref:Tetratricopeptide repeat protein 29 n=1 Tax=Aphanomyces astaci TaxID=112090 RepID=A0A397CVW7_APHAT|nr:hypothetical protein DYB38_003681 [Aphanomyces astaci]RHZ09705.1 hypothetical protein DYB26_004414 [Aphanomyces astaci]
MTTDIGDGTDSEYKAKLAELLDQLNGVTKRGTRAQVAKTHNKLAHHYVAGRDHEMAIEQFERELDIRKESGGSANSRAVSLAHVNLALAHQRSKQFVQSGHFASLVVDSQDYGHAYTIYERCLAVASVPKHQAAALYHMGVCAAEQNHVQVADAHFTRAIDVANSCNAPALVALAQGCLGMLCFFRENLYDAHAELVMALQTARFARSPVAEANIATGLGTVSVMESKFDESATYFELDLAIATTHDDKYGQLRAHCNLGINYLLSGDSTMVNLYDKQGAYEKALAECEHLMAAADAVGDVPLMAESYATMASLLSSQLALLMQRGGSRFQDTINQLTQKRDDVCAKYKVLYDTGKLHPSLRRQDVDRVVLLPWE